MTRQQANREIILLLERYLETHPEIRFGQALCCLVNADEVDLFYEEPQETLKYLKENMEKFQ